MLEVDVLGSLEGRGGEGGGPGAASGAAREAGAGGRTGEGVPGSELPGDGAALGRWEGGKGLGRGECRNVSVCPRRFHASGATAAAGDAVRGALQLARMQHIPRERGLSERIASDSIKAQERKQRALWGRAHPSAAPSRGSIRCENISRPRQ